MDNIRTTQQQYRASRPITNDNSSPLDYRNTLNHATQILKTLKYLYSSKELTRGAQYGFFLILKTAIQSLQHINTTLYDSNTFSTHQDNSDAIKR